MNDEELRDSCLCPPEGDGLDLDAVETDEADEELAQLAKVLGHRARVKIIRILARRRECLCGEIVDELPLA